MTELVVQKDMTDSQKIAFNSVYGQRRKDATVAILLCLFLGGLGAHHFYLGNTGRGVLYALFIWTFIPAIIAFIELFTLSGTVNRMNDEAARAVASEVKALA